jgi:hypothetical protein
VRGAKPPVMWVDFRGGSLRVPGILHGMRWFIPWLLIGCTLPGDDLDGDGWTIQDGDCDDLDPRVNPGATEADDDGIDQDCDGMDPLLRVEGVEHSCILGTAGQIVCDGLESPDPERIWVQIASGYFHTCALDQAGLVDCWGDNAFGQSNAPSGVYATIDAFANHSVAITADGIGLCWGRCPGSPTPD